MPPLNTPTLPPPPATGYAAMGGGTNSGLLWNEGIVQKIAPLTPGNKYSFSFFERISRASFQPNFWIDFQVVLMKCSDYPLIYSGPNQFSTPPHPANSQIIYCEQQVNNTIWQQKSTSFTPDDTYDLIWIYPKGNLTFSESTGLLLFALPELLDVTGFNAGNNPTPSQNCIVTIGPSTPNSCTFTNAVFTWIPPGPNSQPIPAPPNQQIQVDASNPANVGTWTLVMSAANEIPTNNNCSQKVSATVTVSSCSPCGLNITPEGPIDYYLFADSGPIIGRVLTSSIATGNQWYYNNNPIVGATGQTYNIGNPPHNWGTGNYHVMNNGCQSNSVNVEFKQYGYGFFGEEVFDRLGAKVYPIQTPNYLCYNTINNSIQQFNLGAGATYSWNLAVFPSSGTQNIFLTPGSYSPSSSQAQLNISGLTTSSNTHLQGVANLNGAETILDYSIHLTPSTTVPPNQQVCQNAGHI